MIGEDPMVKRAAQAALSGQSIIAPGQKQAEQQQEQPVRIPFEGLMKMVELGVLSKRQAFNLIFRREPPTEFMGPLGNKG